MRTILTVLGMALVALFCKPADSCQLTCPRVTNYHHAVNECEGYKDTYWYFRQIWIDQVVWKEEATLELANARVAYVEHCNNECTRGCDGDGPVLNCLDGQQANARIIAAQGEVRDANDAVEDAYWDRAHSYDDWVNADGITLTLWTSMANHSLDVGHPVCDWTWTTPSW